jgi:hypothetical protein
MFRGRGGVRIQHHSIWALHGLIHLRMIGPVTLSRLWSCGLWHLNSGHQVFGGTTRPHLQGWRTYWDELWHSCPLLRVASTWFVTTSSCVLLKGTDWDLCCERAKWLRSFGLVSSGGRRSDDDHGDVDPTDFLIQNYYLKAEKLTISQ